ncbi:peptidoglycan-binding protein [Stenotrophomonas sp. S41]|uniref:peptidoglycan-binding protein n=1 Tax=Stenotrophomonas sp. S41 TaxID=2767464 RepID=UPI00190D2BE6|nr:peptidoglycan-binding protein [Stenotrophomonas sp. S41]MBK0014147.1 peptidoglycan-binding protein [Stenotrophomonas sp. S41]
MASTHDRKEVLDIIEKQADRSGIPRDDFMRFAYIETGGNFNPDANNTKSGAKGLFQFVPTTAKEFGLTGHEFDPVANTRAAADLYERNRDQIVDRSAETGRPFLSGSAQPNGMDMYLAHQQGGGGYASIQSAIDTGKFSRKDTHDNIVNNISSRDFERVTGKPYESISGMDDRELATSFSQYWQAKYAAIEIADRGITASAPLPAAQGRPSALADGVLERGERGNDVRSLQESLNQLGVRDGQGNTLETNSGIYGKNTQDAVRNFQQTHSLEQTGRADEQTREAIKAQLALPQNERNATERPAAQPQAEAKPQARAEGGATWPAPGNDQINAKDKPGEGRGEFGTSRNGGRTHGGVDIQGDVGDPIVAFGGGRVTVKPNNGAAGNTVHITHDDGSLTKYFHLNDISVRNGQRIEAGDQLGTMGRSGNTPSHGDTHLHFELWRNGRKIDPMSELRGADRGAGDHPAKAGEHVAKPAGEQTLRDGSRGTAVSELQEQLGRLGYKDAQGQPLARDGIYGDATRHAVEDLQRAQGLKVDGVFGPQSRAALKSHAPEQAAETQDKQAAAGKESGGFLDRMFSAARNGDGESVQKAITDFTSTLSQPWAKHQVQEQAQTQTQPQQAQPQAPDAARNSGDLQR